MRRSLVLLLAASIALVACSTGDAVSQDTAVPNRSEPADQVDSAENVDAAEDVASATEGDSVAWPGLLDPSDDEIPNDDEVRTGTLDNGLQYYVRHNERPGDKASFRLAIRAGSADETGPSTGVAHFVEHMLFNGTEQYPENELVDVLRGFGAEFGPDVNAGTSYDETVYKLDVPNDDDSVDTALNMLDQWLSHATFDPAQVESERGIVTDEWRQSTQTVEGRLYEVAEGMYLAGSAYEGRDPIGTEESIATVPVDELRQFYDNWYRPDNAAIVVVGDVDVDAIADDIAERFAAATSRTQSMPERADKTFDVDTVADFALHSDPDQTTVDVEVDLPTPASESNGTAGLRASVLDSMIYSALIRRLDQDVTAGAAPFDDIATGTNSFVASLDAPALYAFTDADRVDATLQALLDEYERADRFGFSESETDTAKAAAQAEFDSYYESRNTTQDVEYADQYVANFVYGDAYPAIDELHEIATDMIEAITPEALAQRLRARWDNSAPHVIISTPQADELAMPTSDEVLAMVAATSERQLSPRPDGRQLPDELMAAPDPIDPASVEQLLDEPGGTFDPVEVVFPNGARVIATSNDIVEGQVGFQAASPGGSSLVADDDVVDALYAADIVTSSGVGEFNQSELDQLLADRSVGVAAQITPYLDTFQGGATTTDLETLFQLVHLYMSQPRFDQVALDQLQRFEQPVVDDPASDPDTAGFEALLDTRYAGEPRYSVLPAPEEFATLDLEGVERVWRDRYGDASDWVFAFSGDVDLDELFDLAARYIATLPGTGSVEQWVDVEDPPPAGVVREVVNAGTGDTSSLTLLFTSPVSGIDGVLRATSDVVAEVVTTRLTDVVREQLGESYSPFAVAHVTNDPDPVIETAVQITGSPDRIESVGDLVVAELADLATNGPTESEFESSYAQVDQNYQFVDNGAFLEEMINHAVWPDRELEDFLDRRIALGEVTPQSVQAHLAGHVPADRYIQVAVVPR